MKLSLPAHGDSFYLQKNFFLDNCTHIYELVDSYIIRIYNYC